MPKLINKIKKIQNTLILAKINHKQIKIREYNKIILIYRGPQKLLTSKNTI